MILFQEFFQCARALFSDGVCMYETRGLCWPELEVFCCSHDANNVCFKLISKFPVFSRQRCASSRQGRRYMLIYLSPAISMAVSSNILGKFRNWKSFCQPFSVSGCFIPFNALGKKRPRLANLRVILKSVEISMHTSKGLDRE